MKFDFTIYLTYTIVFFQGFQCNSKLRYKYIYYKIVFLNHYIKIYVKYGEGAKMPEY